MKSRFEMHAQILIAILNSIKRHTLGDLYDHLINTQIFLLILNEIFTWAPKIHGENGYNLNLDVWLTLVLSSWSRLMCTLKRFIIKLQFFWLCKICITRWKGWKVFSNLLYFGGLIVLKTMRWILDGTTPSLLESVNDKNLRMTYWLDVCNIIQPSNKYPPSLSKEKREKDMPTIHVT